MTRQTIADRPVTDPSPRAACPSHPVEEGAMADLNGRPGLVAELCQWRHRGACRDADPELAAALGVSPTVVAQALTRVRDRSAG
jgi:hypothetical protein